MIRIRLLGGVEVCGANQRSAEIRTRRGEELFAFLVLESGRMFSRSALAGQFWGDLPEDRARRALNTEIWRLASALRFAGLDVETSLLRTRREVGYRVQGDAWVDVRELGAAGPLIASTRPTLADEATLDVVRGAIRAYRGDLLESVYSDWCLIWRESLRAQFTDALDFMLQASMARREWAEALRYARRLLALDPLMEHVHRAAIRCHFQNGDRSMALQQYAQCEKLLREELDVSPMEETRLIRQAVLAAGSGASDPVRLRVPDAVETRRRCRARVLEMALSNIDSARGLLEQMERDLHEGPGPD